MKKLFKISFEITSYYEIEVSAESMANAKMLVGIIKPERFAEPSQTTTEILDFDCEEVNPLVEEQQKANYEEEIAERGIVCDRHGNYFRENGEPFPTKYEIAEKLSMLKIEPSKLYILDVTIVWKDDFSIQDDLIAITTSQIEEDSQTDSDIVYHFRTKEEAIDFVLNNSGQDFQIVDITI